MSSLNCLRKGTPALGSSYVDDEQASDPSRHAIDGAAPLGIELKRLRPDLSIGLCVNELNTGAFDPLVQPRRTGHDISCTGRRPCDRG